jgi:hypothetical protein
MFPPGTEPGSRLPTSESHCQLVAGPQRVVVAPLEGRRRSGTDREAQEEEYFSLKLRN